MHYKILQIFVVISIATFFYTNAGVLSQSQLERCIRTDPNAPPDCSKSRLLLTLHLDHSNVDEFELSTVETEDGTTVNFENPLKVKLRKSKPTVDYELFSMNLIPSKMTEKIIYRTSYILISNCYDGPNDENPTCGWRYAHTGQKIANSQGFCCTCSLAQTLGLSDESRAGLNCKLFSSQQSSAHCLVPSELLYHQFEIAEPKKNFNINITLSQGNTNIGSITLSPQKTIASLPNLEATLVGDFSSYSTPPALHNKYLFVPQSPSTNPIVQAGQMYWMVLDKNLVDTSGTTCNKVGVSYTAFRHQPNACSQLPMSCLQNQLEDYHNADIENMKKGLRTRYFLNGYGDFVTSKVGDENKLLLSYKVDYIENSVVTLYVQANSLKYILNRATGKIEKAWVDKFESLTKNGFLNVHVRSTGNVVATFFVRVDSCSPNINPIQSRSIAIEPSQLQVLTFSVTTNTGLESSNSCEVILEDSIGTKLDSVIVKFDTSVSKPSRDPPENNFGGLEKESQKGKLQLPALFNCPKCDFLDLPCKMLASCWADVVFFVGILIVGIVFCCVFTYCGGWCKCFRCCRFCIKNAKKGKLQITLPKLYKLKPTQKPWEDPEEEPDFKLLYQQQKEYRKKLLKPKTKKKQSTKISNIKELTLDKLKHYIKERRVFYRNRVILPNEKGDPCAYLPMKVGKQFTVAGHLIKDKKNPGNAIFTTRKYFEEQWYAWDDELEEYVTLDKGYKLYYFDIVSLPLERFTKLLSVVPLYQIVNKSPYDEC